MKRYTILLLASFIGSTTFAADAPSSSTGHNGPMGPCKADVEKLCPGIKPGGGRIAACLKDNKDKVSDTCKARLEKIREKRESSTKSNASTNNQ